MRGGPAGQDLGRLDREGKENTLTRGWDTRRVKRCYPSKQTNKQINRLEMGPYRCVPGSRLSQP